jgi:CubicO group peptidase (beta-lactamase class C family)
MKRRTLAAWAAAWLFAIGVAACHVNVPPAATSPPSPEAWPVPDWTVTAPEQQGMSSARLADAIERILANGWPVHGLLVIRHGVLVAEAYFHPFPANGAHDVASVTKSVTSTLVGIAIDRGAIPGVGAPVASLLPAEWPEGACDAKRAMTLADLLTMSSGLACTSPFVGDARTILGMMAGADWPRYALALRQVRAPGRRFDYCSPNSHLLAAIVRRRAGARALDYARTHLFGPLGIEDVGWPTDPAGLDNHGWGDLRLHPRDMARLGLLYLRRGRWEGRQVVPTAWVDEATRRHVGTRRARSWRGYGYQWWVDRGMVAALGRGGQAIVVVPAKDLVVVLVSGGLKSEQRDRLLRESLVPAVVADGPLPANAAGEARLADAIRRAASPPAVTPRPAPLPEIAGAISGAVFDVTANLLGIRTLALTFDGDGEARLRIEVASGPPRELRVGLDGVARTFPGQYGLPATAVGRWTGDSTFVADLNELGNINRWRVRFAFRDRDHARIRIEESTGLPGASAAAVRRVGDGR